MRVYRQTYSCLNYSRAAALKGPHYILHACDAAEDHRIAGTITRMHIAGRPLRVEGGRTKLNLTGLLLVCTAACGCRS